MPAAGLEEGEWLFEESLAALEESLGVRGCWVLGDALSRA